MSAPQELEPDALGCGFGLLCALCVLALMLC